MGCAGSKDSGGGGGGGGGGGAAMSFAPPPRREETPEQKAAKEREKQEDGKWVEHIRATDPERPDKPVLKEGASEEEYKEYMRERYDFEQWENSCILKARKARKAHTDAGGKWLVDGGTPGGGGGGGASAAPTAAVSSTQSDDRSAAAAEEKAAATAEKARQEEAERRRQAQAAAAAAPTSAAPSATSAPAASAASKLGLPAPETLSTDPQTVDVIRELQSFLLEGLITREDYNLKIAELK